MKPLRFHWSLSQVGDKLRRSRPNVRQTGLLDFEAQVAFAKRAEECGIESLLMATGFARPDPIALSAALGGRTERIGFMVACRSGLQSPTLFVQQINTLSYLTGGRVCVNIVAGHSPHELRYYGDHLPHDERYERTAEFLTVCNAFWRGEGSVTFSGKHYRIDEGRLNTPFVSPTRRAPEIYLGGSSELAAKLAGAHADCLWRFPDTRDRMRPEVDAIVAQGKEVGLLVSLIARPTREEARRDARELVDGLGATAREANRDFTKRSDSVGFRSTFATAEERGEWLDDCLWTGAIPTLGAPAIALVGGKDEIVETLSSYRAMGISQFLFIGWPDLDEMTYFGREILPLVRASERGE